MINVATTNLPAGYTYTFRINFAYGPGITFSTQYSSDPRETSAGKRNPPDAFFNRGLRGWFRRNVFADKVKKTPEVGCRAY
jgi:hypothetical protein